MIDQAIQLGLAFYKNKREGIWGDGALIISLPEKIQRAIHESDTSYLNRFFAHSQVKAFYYEPDPIELAKEISTHQVISQLSQLLIPSVSPCHKTLSVLFAEADLIMQKPKFEDVVFFLGRIATTQAFIEPCILEQLMFDCLPTSARLDPQEQLTSSFPECMVIFWYLLEYIRDIKMLPGLISSVVVHELEFERDCANFHLKYPNTEALEFLLEYNPDPNGLWRGMTSLDLALRYLKNSSDSEFIQLLLRMGAKTSDVLRYEAQTLIDEIIASL